MLQMDDLLVSEDRVLFHLRRTKTDQSGEGQVISLGISSVKELCPVSAILQYVQVRGDSGGDLLCHKDGSPLSRYQFWTVTSWGFQAAGIVG